MSGHLAIIRAVLLKDLRLLWPLGVLCAATILAQALPVGASALADYLPLVAMLASGFFVIALIHLDAPASLRDEFLTRPIPRADLVLAKALLAFGLVLLPAALGPALDAVFEGASVSQALLSALGGLGRWLVTGFLLLVVAAVTTSLLEAVGVLIGFFLLFLFAPPVIREISGLTETVLFLGSGWVVLSALGLIALVGGGGVLWLQYGARRTHAARLGLAGVVAMVGVAMSLLSWNVIFAVQKAASPINPAAGRFSLALTPGCFETAAIDPLPQGVEADRADGPWSAAERRAAGVGAVGFRTAVTGLGLPEGWRMQISDVKARFLDAEGKRLHSVGSAPYNRLWRVDEGGRLQALDAWLIRRERFDALARDGAQLRLDYSLALLAPVRTAEIPIDSRRRHIAGLGSCAAFGRSAGGVQVICFTAGQQPDLLTARRLGATADHEVRGGFPDYAPGLLQLSPGQRREMLLAPAEGPPSVTITAYEARAHVARSVAAPGLLAGPPAACPAPGGVATPSSRPGDAR